MAAITTFNRRAAVQQGETGAKGRKRFSPKKKKKTRRKKQEREVREKNEEEEEKRGEREKEIGSDLSVVLPVSGERSPSFLFVCLCLILKGWMLSGRAIQTGVLSGVAQAIFHVTELGKRTSDFP